MLLGNCSVLNKSLARFSNGTATAGAYVGNTRSNYKNPSVLRSRDIAIGLKSSQWDGYGHGSAFVVSRSSGGLAAHTTIDGQASILATLLEVKLAIASLSGNGQISNAALSMLSPIESALSGSGQISSAALLAISNLLATFDGSGVISSANLSANIPIASTLIGSGAVVANLTGIGRLGADIVPYTELSPESLAAAVWNAILADYNEAGSAGAGLANASSAGNPWSALLADNIDPDSFGEFVQKLLTKNNFLGLKD